MHLKQLKLSGFKSFVDPTAIPFSSPLVGIVGPNGCGKSNIIDAIRWVMGESSAKNLRGESMADVIFNGSSNRKSLGQASVELLFDNSLGRLTGPYASYQELSLKRTVTRDGDSFYSLNGSRCRRRDITDIFLGTGAGARGYSIIGQDTISRLIEARPEELRVFLEEAAGVSKYKERRRETVQRIAETKDNLLRVADIRDELGQQLRRLERQAAAAQSYQQLKQDERQYRSLLLALQWQEVMAEHSDVCQVVRRVGLQYEQHQTAITGGRLRQQALKQALVEKEAHVQQCQAVVYQHKVDMTRLEMQLEQQQQEQQRFIADKEEIHLALQTVQQRLANDKRAITRCEEALVVLQHDKLLQQTALDVAEALLQEQELQKSQSEQRSQQLMSTLQQATHVLQKEELRLQHVASRRSEMVLRLEKIQNEQEQMLIEEDKIALRLLTTEQEQYDEEQQRYLHELQRITAALDVIRQEDSSLREVLLQTEDELRAVAVEEAALLAAEQAFRLKAEASLPAHWAVYPRLVDTLTVAEPWLRAAEMVFGDVLLARVVASFDEWVLLASQENKSFVPLVIVDERSTSSAGYPRLIDKITGKIPNWLYAMEDIFAADSLSEAWQWLPSLRVGQSVVTPDGCWLGPGWFVIHSFEKEDNAGALGRQQALTAVKARLAGVRERLLVLQERRRFLHHERETLEQQQQKTQQAFSDVADRLRDIGSKVNRKTVAVEQSLIRARLLLEEKEELQLGYETLAEESVFIQQTLEQAQRRVADAEIIRVEESKTTVNWDEALRDARGAVVAARELFHQTELQCHKETLTLRQLQEGITRDELEQKGLQKRYDALLIREQAILSPDVSLSLSLQEKVLCYHQAEQICHEAQEAMRGLSEEDAHLLQTIQKEEQAARLVQDELQQQQRQEHELAIQARTLLLSLQERGGQVDDILAGMPADSTKAFCEETLRQIQERLNRLGAVNLVAIEEFHTEAQRKQELYRQYQDLMDALSVLDAAIVKMDKETEWRLKDTFDAINTSFQRLFPRLFGGGRALLELTCDNLLEAGILVKAAPPGKRNSTIHLLSGGEKAMTAVALVFAIFELNPSPFCLLDEVDAPLDDLNVRRFCDLVKEMSQFVQFLFITHNKVTMELADHLIGVTMREPGVSRVVSVDVNEALAIEK